MRLDAPRRREAVRGGQAKMPGSTPIAWFQPIFNVRPFNRDQSRVHDQPRKGPAQGSSAIFVIGPCRADGATRRRPSRQLRFPPVGITACAHQGAGNGISVMTTVHPRSHDARGRRNLPATDPGPEGGEGDDDGNSHSWLVSDSGSG
jgi:hypothetical protein